MKDKYFLPWELAAMLALLGFNEPCIALWGRAHTDRRMKPRTCHDETNFWEWELRSGRTDLVRMLQAAKQGASLNVVFRGRNVAAASYETVMDWFREVYNIDFIERPSVAATKKYVCDPVGPGFANIRLEAKSTFLEARLSCITYLLDNVKAKIAPFNGIELVEEDPEPCEVSYKD